MIEQSTKLAASVSDLAVITCHFNWCNYKSPKANLRRFLRFMEFSKVPVYGIELYMEGQKPVTTQLEGWQQFQVDESAILWQKEALLNKVAKQVPNRFTKLAWIDADLTFNKPDWAAALSQKLDSHPIIQAFERCHWTDQEGEVVLSRDSFVKAGTPQPWTGHPGFALAAQRSFFELCGLYEGGIMGNGDTILAASLTRQDAIKWLTSVSYQGKFGFDSPSTKTGYLEWAEKVYAFGRLGAGLGYLNGIQVTHDWHGDREDRQYKARYAWMAGFDIEREVHKTPEGYLKWTDQACPVRVEAAHQYFLKRKEDGQVKA